MSYMDVANTILAQLGGSRFKLMTGASSFAGGRFPQGPGLSFRIPGGKGVIITLNGRDYYDIQVIKHGYFRKDKWFESVITGEAQDVSVESLSETFTRLTGLHTSLAA